ncbi:MAG: glucosaminidase domain-containing protein [Nonlabens sp.]
MRFLKAIAIFIVMFTMVSCGSKRKATSTKKPSRKVEVVKKPEVVKDTDEKVTVITKPRSKDRVVNYIDDFKAAAIKEMKLYKIPASITLAQGILESGSGVGRLAVEANNHFGIKCHKGWKGGRIYHDDDEDQECFRKYKDPDYSYRDHSLFLTQRKRYSKLFDLDPDDYKGWARGLRKAGYATDKKYPQKLISLIERYDLHQYDEIALGGELTNDTKSSASEARMTHLVVAGDTLYSLSKKYGLKVEEIMQLNNLTDTALSVGQTLKLK